MRVLIDTNILISAALSNKGTPFAAFKKAVTYPNHGLICEQNIDEMRRIFNRKFPKKIEALEKFLSESAEYHVHRSYSTAWAWVNAVRHFIPWDWMYICTF